MRYRIGLFIVLLTAGQILIAQESIDLNPLIEELESEADRATVSERLEYLLLHPVDLNTADEEELARIPFFDSFFIRNFLLFRAKRGRIKSVYELKEVQGAPLTMLPLLEPFFTIDGPFSEVRPPKKARNRLFLGTEILLPHHPSPHRSPALGFRYEGNRQMSERWGIVMGKDRGEPWQSLRNGWADHLSFSYEYRSRRVGGPQIVLGDFRVTTGLGLLMGQSMSYFSKVEATSSSPSVSPKMIRPHLSFRENDYLRGIAFGQTFGALSTTFYCGSEAVDARIEGGKVKTLYRGGMHRTAEELKYRKSVRLSTIGTNLSYVDDRVTVGFQSVYQRFRDRERQLLAPPDRFSVAKNLLSSSIYFQYLGHRHKLFGETQLASFHRMASILGVTFFDDYFGTLTLIGRYYGAEHYTLYGETDTRYSSGRDEKGMQIIWRGELGYRWIGALHLDLFDRVKKEPSASKNIGWAGIAKADYRGPNTRFRGHLAVIRLPDCPVRSTLRLNVYHTLAPRWELKSHARLTFSARSLTARSVAVGLLYRGEGGLSAEVGLQLFDVTSGFLSAISPYMPYRYHWPMLRGKGVRTTAAVHCPLGKGWQVNGRSALTFYRSPLPTAPLPSLLDLSLLRRF